MPDILASGFFRTYSFPMRLKGELKKKSGKFTDDELLQFEGDDEILSGNAQLLFGDQKKNARKWAEDRQAKN